MEMGPIDSALFKIKMDIMLIKSEVLQLKDELADYVSNIVNLHLGHLKNKIDQRSKLNEEDCELGLNQEEQGDADEEESEENDSEEGYDEEESEENDSETQLSEEDSEEFTDEEELIFSEEDGPLKEKTN